MKERKDTAAGSTERPGGRTSEDEQTVSRTSVKTAEEAMDQCSPPGGSGQPELTDAIARQLRSAYGELLQMPVPDRFLELLKKLETKGSGGDDGEEKSS